MFPGPAWTVDILLASAGAVAALLLLAFYARVVMQRRSRLALGLAIFSLVFLVQNIAAVVVYFGLAAAYSADVALPIMALHAMELVGVGAMVWVVRQ